MELLNKQTHIDFMGKFKTALMISGVLILVGFVSIAMHGGLKYGIDFEGGTLVQLKFPEAPAIDSIRSEPEQVPRFVEERGQFVVGHPWHATSVTQWNDRSRSRGQTRRYSTGFSSDVGVSPTAVPGIHDARSLR